MLTTPDVSEQTIVRLNIIIDSEAWFSCLPFSPGKIGDLDRNTALCNRYLGERSVHTHNDGVIDVNRCLRSILYGIDEEL